MASGPMDDTLANIRKKLKRLKKGKDEDDAVDAPAVPEGGEAVAVAAGPEDLQGGGDVEDMGEGVADEGGDLEVVANVVPGEDGLKGPGGDLGLGDSLSVLFRKPARKSRQQTSKNEEAEGVEAADSQAEEALNGGSGGLASDETAKGTKKRRRRRTKAEMEEMRAAAAAENYAKAMAGDGSPRRSKAKPKAAYSDRRSRAAARRAVEEVPVGELAAPEPPPDLERKPDEKEEAVNKEEAADDGLSLGETLLQDVETSRIVEDGSRNSSDGASHCVEVPARADNCIGLNPCSGGEPAAKASHSAANASADGVSDAQTCSETIAEDINADAGFYQDKPPAPTIKRKPGRKPKEAPKKPVSRKELPTVSADAKPVEIAESDASSKQRRRKNKFLLARSTTVQSNSLLDNKAGSTGDVKYGNIKPNAAVPTEESLDQPAAYGVRGPRAAKDSHASHNMAASAKEIDIIDVAAPSNFEDMENTSKVKRLTRNTRKRKHGDMAYEGDIDWETLMHEQGLFSNPSAGFADQSVKPKDKIKALEVLENGGVAAVSAGLMAEAVSPMEKIKFKDVLKRKGGLKDYLECRYV